MSPLLCDERTPAAVEYMEGFFAQYRSGLPFLVSDIAVPADGRERRQSVDDRERFDDTTKCILFAECTTSCPSFWADENFVGPATAVTTRRTSGWRF